MAGGSYALTKAGTGTLVLGNTATYTGGTTVSTGTLQIGTGGTVGGLASTGTAPSISSGAALAFNLSNTYTYALVIGGAGGVTQWAPARWP